MSSLSRLVGLAGIAGLVAVVLFLPRRVPLTGSTVHPFLLGNDLALRFAIDWPMLALYAGGVIVVTAALTYLLRGR